MLSNDPEQRPTASELLNSLSAYDISRRTGSLQPLFGPCCGRTLVPLKTHAAAIAELKFEIMRLKDQNSQYKRDSMKEMERLKSIADSEAASKVDKAQLRFGALMTSKWLSYGRVIFSPVHFELRDPTQDRVLVIDGTGKDWSYYCALSYPEATVYDMGPEPQADPKVARPPSEPWSILSNHRHIHHPSLSNPFPFPTHFFVCVVLRLPIARASSVYRFILAESKRVLRPGGYVEFSVLDIDLVNMGDHGRRALRGMKMRIQQEDESISLRNVSDEVLAAIGSRGFIECNSSVARIPVASGLVASGLHQASFSDLLNHQQPSESVDNGVTDMVTRVGQWWYSCCYEALATPKGDEFNATGCGGASETSIWHDKKLITECRKRGTSFRLLIGYAQKPHTEMRRTLSL